MPKCPECGSPSELRACDELCPACFRSLTERSAQIGFHESRDAEGVQVWSPGMEHLFGLPTGSFNGSYREWVRRIDPADRDNYENARKTCIEKRQAGFKFQYRVLRADGETRWIEERSRLFFSETGAIERIAGASIDVTDLRELEPPVECLPDPHPSSEEIQRFVYAVTHDLQEPLRGIGTLMEMFRSRTRGALDQDSEKVLDSVAGNVQRMRRLIQDVLEFARIGHEPGPVYMDVDTQALVPAVIKNLQEAMQDSGARISYDGLPVVRANEGQLARVFQNLIVNAIKYHGEIAPDIRVAAIGEADTWTFSVRDNGIGIDPKYHLKIFGTFQRLHSRAQYEGNGFGLAICERIIRRHQGRIWVQSERGKGSTFYFTIPKRASDREGLRQSLAASDAG